MNNEIKTAIARSHQQNPNATWRPIFADVEQAGEKVGHIVSDGYSNTTWSFFPVATNRRSVRGRDIADVIPAWVRNFDLGAFKTYDELLAPLASAAMQIERVYTQSSDL